MSGGPVTVTADDKSREFYDFNIKFMRALGEKEEELILRFDRAQMILLRAALDKLVPAIPLEPVPSPSERH